ncbi:MAG: mevalonate kinase [Bacteroidota bacterium]
MNNEIRELTISTPGRICLFGEHQDYLFLPVIPCAISLRMVIDGKRRNDSVIHLNLPDILNEITFPMDGIQKYKLNRDYFRSGFNVLNRKNFSFNGGFDCTVHGDIPINAGTSSSSALIISWINFLANMSEQKRNLTPGALAWFGYEAEVLEFTEPGGMMDQYAATYGGITYIDFLPDINVKKIRADLKQFVLGNSCEPKDTKHILARVKNRILSIASNLVTEHPGFSLLTAQIHEIEEYRSELSKTDYELLIGTLRNRDITSEARTLLCQIPLNHHRVGELLTEHQKILRDVLKISTLKIDRMLDAALNAGAYGGKINGSGGGGCMFAYTPEAPEKVAEAIRCAGGIPYIVSVDSGSRIERLVS